MEISQSYVKNNFAQFFDTQCSGTTHFVHNVTYCRIVNMLDKAPLKEATIKKRSVISF